MKKPKFIIPCKMASKLISKSFDTKLSFGEQIALRLHLFSCKLCLNALRKQKILKQIFNHYTKSITEIKPSTDKSLPLEAKHRLQSQLQKALE